LKRKDFSVDEEAPFGLIQEQVVSLKSVSNITRPKKRNMKPSTQNMIDMDDTEERLI
jgi:hypothetical protein